MTTVFASDWSASSGDFVTYLCKASAGNYFSYQDTTRVTQVYDPVGNRTLLHDRTGRYTMTFDDVNRNSVSQAPNSKTITLTYDKVSQRATMAVPGAGKVTYTHDPERQLTKLANSHNETTTLVYDDAGRKTLSQQANGTKASMAYDAANRMSQVVNLKSTNTTLSYYNYGFDRIGDRTSIWDNGTDVSNWNYDLTGQLTNDVIHPATTALTWYGLTIDQWNLLSVSGWDGLLVDAVPTGGAGLLAYDPAGNRLTQIDPVTGDITTFIYDNGNRLTRATDISGITTRTSTVPRSRGSPVAPIFTLPSSDYSLQLVCSLSTDHLSTETFVRRNHRRSLYNRLQVECLEGRTLLSVAQFVPNEVLVKFKDGVAEADKVHVRGVAQAAQVERIQTDAMLANGYGELEWLRGPADVLATVARLKNNPLVAFAEPNWVFSHQAVSNDPYYTNGSLWGMYSNDSPSSVGPTGTTNQYGSQAEEAWAAGYTGSQTVYVGIIDEGIQFAHPDLNANVWTNSYDPVDGIDNDLNGYTDDTHGWDFINGDNTIYDGTSDDHGTHVTGTIGAEGGNSTGVVGVNWNVTYISGKFLGSNGGTTTGAIKALDYMTDLKVRHGLNIVATNNSWGGGGFSQGLLDAITRGAKQNILFIAAAGNGGSDRVGDDNDTTANYPSNYDTTVGAGYDAVVAVAAIDNNGSLASFSNFGANTVDLGASGVGVYSTVPTGSYASYSGTSMATPHVTGAAALYASTHAGATAAQIKAAILNSTKATTSLNAKTVTGGRLDVSALMGTTPAFSIDDVNQAEGDAGTTNFTFTVTLSVASSQPLSVQYATVDGIAVAGSDYAAASGTLSFAANETSKTVTVAVNGDTASEVNETFFVNLSNASGATIADSQGVGTIRNDDGLPGLAISDVTKFEGQRGSTSFTFTATLSYASANTVTVYYVTADGSAKTSDKDYTAASGTLTFNPGEISKTITVSVRGDTKVEPDETFFVNLSSPTNAILADSQGLGTIRNDDGGSTGLSAFGNTASSSPKTSIAPALDPATSLAPTVAPRGPAGSPDTAGVDAYFASIGLDVEWLDAFTRRGKRRTR